MIARSEWIQPDFSPNVDPSRIPTISDATYKRDETHVPTSDLGRQVDNQSRGGPSIGLDARNVLLQTRQSPSPSISPEVPVAAPLPELALVQLGEQNNLKPKGPSSPESWGDGAAQALITRREVQLPEQNVADPNDAISLYLEKTRNQFEADKTDFSERAERTATEVIQQLLPDKLGLSAVDRLKDSLVRKGIVAANQTDKIDVEIVGMSHPFAQSMVTANYGSHYFRATLPGGDVRFFQHSRGFNQFNNDFTELKSEPTSRMLSTRNDSELGWEVSVDRTFTTSGELAQRAEAFKKVQDFEREAGTQVRKLAQNVALSPKEYLENKLPVFSPEAKTQLESELAHLGRQIEAFPTDVDQKQRAELEAKSAACHSVLLVDQRNATLREHYENILKSKQESHAKDWDWNSFEQLPAQYVDAGTGQKSELPLMVGNDKSGNAIIFDLRDGGVYKGDKNAGGTSAAMQDYLKQNNLPIGFVAYSLDGGSTVKQAPCYDTNDERWAKVESAGSYLGYSALSGLLLPDLTITKAYSAVAGLASTGIAIASSSRHIISDISHERNLDILDILNVGSGVLTGIATKGALNTQEVSAAAKALQYGIIVSGLATDSAQVAISSNRLYNSLDLGDPGLPPEIRAQRLEYFYEQSLINGGLLLTSGIQAIRGGTKSHQIESDQVVVEKYVEPAEEKSVKAADSVIPPPYSPAPDLEIVDGYGGQIREAESVPFVSHWNPSREGTIASSPLLDPIKGAHPKSAVELTPPLMKLLAPEIEDFQHPDWVQKNFGDLGLVRMPTVEEWNKCPDNSARISLVKDYWGESRLARSNYEDTNNLNQFQIKAKYQAMAREQPEQVRKIDRAASMEATKSELDKLLLHQEIDSFVNSLPEEITRELHGHIFRKNPENAVAMIKTLRENELSKNATFHTAPLAKTAQTGELADFSGGQILAIGNSHQPAADLKAFIVNSAYTSQIPELKKLFPDAQFFATGDFEGIARYSREGL